MWFGSCVSANSHSNQKTHHTQTTWKLPLTHSKIVKQMLLARKRRQKHEVVQSNNRRVPSKRLWMRPACFKLKFKRSVFKWKRFVSKPGVWLTWGGQRGKQTDSGKKKLFPAEKQTFPSPRGPRNRLVSGSGNKGFVPERVFSGQENSSFETLVASFRN